MAQKGPSPGFLSLTYLFADIALSAIAHALTYPLRSRRAAIFSQDVMFAAVRAMLGRMTIAESRYINALTTQGYLDSCRKKGVEPKTTPVKTRDGEVLAHWIGNQDADVVVLYLHGGGYTQPCAAVHLEYLHRLVTDFNGLGHAKSFAVVVLAYSLAPEKKHPTALREAAATLAYLLDEGGKSPSQILIAGDSAGGGLTFSLLSHLRHPHPEVPAVKLSQPLQGAFTYSPWVDFRTDADSFYRNAKSDVLLPRCLHVWAAMYMDKVKGDPEADPGCQAIGDSYTDPASNNITWWQGFHDIVGDVLIYVGANEVFVDGIASFQKQFRRGWEQGGGQDGRILYIETPNEAHIHPITDSQFRPKFKSDSQSAIEEWLKARIESSSHVS